MKHALPTIYSSWLASGPASLLTRAASRAALALAATLDRQADLHLSERRTAHADQPSCLVLDLRCRATAAQA